MLQVRSDFIESVLPINVPISNIRATVALKYYNYFMGTYPRLSSPTVCVENDAENGKGGTTRDMETSSYPGDPKYPRQDCRPGRLGCSVRPFYYGYGTLPRYPPHTWTPFLA